MEAMRKEKKGRVSYLKEKMLRITFEENNDRLELSQCG